MFVAVCAALSLAGLALIVFGARRFLRDRQRAATAGSWGTAEGEVVSASLDARESVDAEGDSVTLYRPEVRYRYAAAGTEHTGSRVWLNREAFVDAGEAKAWLADHPAGGRVVVRFDPAQPAMSTLVVDRPSLLAAIATTGLGIVFLWIGGSLLMG